MSPADLKSLAQEAALAAMARNASSVTQADFDQALQRIAEGERAESASFASR